jgi:hypothetical protein
MDILDEITAAYYRPTTYLHVLITVQSSRVPGTFRPISVGTETTVVVLQPSTLSALFKSDVLQEEEGTVTQVFVHKKSPYHDVHSSFFSVKNLIARVFSL